MDDLVKWLNDCLDLLQSNAERLPHREANSEVDRCPACRTEPVGDLLWGEDNCDCLRDRDVARSLARVEAERRLIAVHEPVQDERRIWGTHINSIGYEVPNFEPVPGSFHCSFCSGEYDGPVSMPCDQLRLFAYGHRFDVPGWNDEWKPWSL